MNWRKLVLLDEPIIDEHHIQLLRFIANIKDAREITKEEFLKHITTLVDYATYHFQYEENLMKKFHYPLYEKHKQVHGLFMDKINQWVDEFNNMPYIISEEELDKIIQFGMEWLNRHIMYVDRKFIEYLQENNYHIS